MQILCMDLEYTILQMGIDMKDHGMKEEDKGLVCTLSEMVKPNLGIGKMGFLISQVHIPQHNRIHHHLQLLQSIILEFLMQSRKQEDQQRKHMM